MVNDSKLGRLVCTMSRRKPQLVPKPAVVTGLSPEEEVRALQLADIALHNAPEGVNTSQPAGNRAKGDHRRLIEELQQEAEKVVNAKRSVA